MAAGEDQPQAVVRELIVPTLRIVRRAERLQALEDGPLLEQRALAAQAIDRLVAGDAGDPGAGVVRRAVARPALEGHHERLLHRLLGEVEVAQHADQRRDRPSRLVPEQAVDDGDRIGRGLAGPGRRAAGRSYEASAFASAGSKPNSL